MVPQYTAHVLERAKHNYMLRRLSMPPHEQVGEVKVGTRCPLKEVSQADLLCTDLRRW